MQSEDDGILTCVKVINAACLSSEGLDRLLQFFEIGRSLKSLNDRHLEPVAQSMVSRIISDVQERGGHWLVLVRTYVPLGEEMDLPFPFVLPYSPLRITTTRS